jgi:hypothetical protein
VALGLARRDHAQHRGNPLVEHPPVHPPVNAMRFCVGAIGFIWIVACHHRARDDTPAALSSEDSVYRSVLAQEAESLSPNEQLQVAGEIPALFASDEAAHAWVDTSRRLMAAVPPPTLLAFARANRISRQLDHPSLLTGHTVVGVSAQASDSGRGVVQLSRVSFNEERDSAVVMVTRRCGALCGSSRILLAVRDTAEWRVVRTLWQVSF